TSLQAQASVKPSFIFVLNSNNWYLELKSLPKLATSIGNMLIDGCSSLEVVGSPSKECNLMGRGCISAINCFNLAKNINALTILKTHLKVEIVDKLIRVAQAECWVKDLTSP
ncbi:hypothetical protein J1N35_023942, partial [Gossypium stocksii]